MARRAEISIELIGAIEAEVKKGHWPDRVAKRLGVHGKTYSTWMKKGEQAFVEDTDTEIRDDGYLYRQLYERVEEAEAFAEMDLLDKARTQAELGKTTWNGYLTTLERRFPDRWRRREPGFGDLSDTFEGRMKAFLAASQAQTTEPTRLKAVPDE